MQRKFVWGGTDAGGWLLLMELDGSDNVVRKYTWGLDLAGQHGSVNSLESAGGIGGLLAAAQAQVGGGSAAGGVDAGEYVFTYDANGNVAQAQVGGGSAAGGVDAGEYVFTYDANGNVAQVLDLSAGSAAAAIAAHYEYDPYGGVVNNLSGYTYAEANPIRFSTKYHDAETGLGCWGYRYYSARLGRWLSRDPLEEDGGWNLYVYALNSALQAIDHLGLQSHTPRGIRTRLNECIQTCRRIQPLYPRWSGWNVYDCIESCNRTWLVTNFWSCSRNMSKEGADCWGACNIGAADLIENHGFVSYGLSLDWAYTLRGDPCETKGTMPREEGGFPGLDSTCWRCYRRDVPLKHGSGAGKKAYEASVDEIKDCIRNTPLRHDYNAFTYNCNDWLRDAQRACGLSCPRFGFAPQESGRIPAPRR